MKEMLRAKRTPFCFSQSLEVALCSNPINPGDLHRVELFGSRFPLWEESYGGDQDRSGTLRERRKARDDEQLEGQR